MEKPNPNSHRRPKSWSDLPIDLLCWVFERLSFADFTRGKSVCSSWRSGSRQSAPKNQIPWLILFPRDKDDNFCTLFNPEEKHKLYKTQDLGLGFGKSVCKATYGNWLLMRDPRVNFYIVNIFTLGRITLPIMESLQIGTTKIERTLEDGFRLSNHYRRGYFSTKNYTRDFKGNIQSPVFWIDEKTKDYVVIWGLGRECVVYSKKGDNLWNQIPETSYCHDLVYKDHKLYFLSYFGCVKIFDFSGETPQETFRYSGGFGRIETYQYCGIGKLVVTHMRCPHG